ncbi:bacteriohemerythrin [Halomicrobium sp. IBSBa]|nr:bacteriohemerythrin [Halomicrobium sp. IBSBa]
MLGPAQRMQLESEDAFARWDDERYSTQIDRFDEQHKRLFGLLNDLHTAMDEGHSQDEIGDILRELERYTEYHFGDEEEFMQDCGYAMDCADCFYDHREMHEEFASTVSDFRERHEDGEYVTMEVLTFLRDWLDSHIAAGDEDQRYSEYYQTEIDETYEYTPGTLRQRRHSESPPETTQPTTVSVEEEVLDGGELSVPAGPIASWFEQVATTHGDRVATIEHDGDEQTERTFESLYERATAVAGGLLETELTPGDRLAIDLESNGEALLFDLASHLAGLVSVPLYPSFDDEQLRSIVTTAEIDGFASPGDPPSAVERAVDVVVDTEPLPASPQRSLPGLNRRGTDLATIVYQVPAGGEPTGVELTHRNLRAAIAALSDALPLDPDATGTALLPFAHVSQRVGAYYLWDAGATVAYTDRASSVEALPALSPDVLIGVPKLYQQLYGELQDRIGSFGWAKRKVAGSVTGYGRDVIDGSGTPLKYAAAERLAYRPLRQEFGLDDLTYALSCSGRLDDHLLDFFHGLGVPLCELYGTAETSAVGTINGPDDFERDSVGEALSGVTVGLSADSDVLIDGPTVMDGYCNDPEATERAVHDGWFRTDDDSIDGSDLGLSE